jgi:hypothetical protein
MRPGEDKLHAFPAQKLSLAQKAKDLDLEELAEHALIPGRHRVPDTVTDPSRMQIPPSSSLNSKDCFLRSACP